MTELSCINLINNQKRIDFIKWLLIFFGVLSSFLLLVVPIFSIFWEALRHGVGESINTLKNKDLLHAIWLTILISLLTVPVNLFFGIHISWLVTRFNFPGRQILLTMLDIPFAVSPVVAGLLCLLFWGINSPVGHWFDLHGIEIMFSWPGMTLATIFVTCPLIVREIVPIMLSQGKQEDEAAVLLGASWWQMFYHVTFPNIRWALLYGIILTNARAIGEFGAVSVVSGSIRGETYTLPLQVELLHQDYDSTGAFTAAALLALIAIITLFLKNVVHMRRNYEY